MEKTDCSFKQFDGRVFALDKHRLKVFRVFPTQVYEVRDVILRTTVRLRGSEISEEAAYRISRFDGDLESALKTAG
ncbi:MAG: hypothetical protein P4L43_11260 [Syntrophobacteraceae bacterium]|nr:hypothetical protein [Syntrophobacteraceae bacterium]